MITYVSALLDMGENDPKDFDYFNQLPSIPIVLFLSKKYRKYIKERPNIIVILIELEDLITYKESLPVCELPYICEMTKNEHVFTNAKIEFIEKAMDVVTSTHYAWIDFNIAQLFSNSESVIHLENISKSSLEPCLFIPGCYEKYTLYSCINDQINYRFYGNFFIGDKESLLNMYRLYRDHYVTIIRYNTLWEVNVWAILEMEYEWKVDWYRTFQDDSLIYFPK